MKVEFVFNTTTKLILIPEGPRDKQLLSLAFVANSQKQLRVGPSTTDNLVIEISDSTAPALAVEVDRSGL